jgi:hypothetical protein
MKMKTATATRPAVKLVKVEIWLPEDLVKIGHEIADSVGHAHMSHVCADALHDIAMDARLPVADPVRENYDVLYAELKR